MLRPVDWRRTLHRLPGNILQGIVKHGDKRGDDDIDFQFGKLLCKNKMSA